MAVKKVTNDKVELPINSDVKITVKPVQNPSKTKVSQASVKAPIKEASVTKSPSKTKAQTKPIVTEENTPVASKNITITKKVTPTVESNQSITPKQPVKGKITPAKVEPITEAPKTFIIKDAKLNSTPSSEESKPKRKPRKKTESLHLKKLSFEKAIIEKKEKNEKRNNLVYNIFKISCIVLLVGFLVFGFLAKQIFGDESVFYTSVYKIVNLFDGIEDNLSKILSSISYIVIVYAISKLFRFIIKLCFSKIRRWRSIMNLLDSFIKYFAGILALLLVLSTWGVNTTTLLTGVGIVGLVIGLAAQGLIEDIISGIFIVFEHEFNVGDIIVIDGFRGSVSDIGMRTTKLVDYCGNVKVINNSDIRTIINMTAQESLAICDVQIDYAESIERVENIISRNLDYIRSNIPAVKEGPYYKGVSALGDNGVTIRLVAKCREDDRFQTERDLNREIKILFDKYNVNIPFPQVVINYPKGKKSSNEEEKESAKRFVDEQKSLSKSLDDDNE